MTAQQEAASDEQMYRIPDYAYEHLLMIRDQLSLLATLIEPATRAEENTPREIPLGPLAQGISIIAGQLNDVLEAVE